MIKTNRSEESGTNIRAWPWVLALVVGVLILAYALVQITQSDARRAIEPPSQEPAPTSMPPHIVIPPSTDPKVDTPQAATVVSPKDALKDAD